MIYCFIGLGYVFGNLLLLHDVAMLELENCKADGRL